MQPLILIYCEGSETKTIVVSKEKSEVKIIRTIASAVDQSAQSSTVEGGDGIDFEDFSGDINFDESEDSFHSEEDSDSSDLSYLATELSDINLKQSQFIPVVTEPNINYHLFEIEHDSDKKKMKNAAKEDILQAKGLSITDDLLDCVTLSENSAIAAYLEGDNSCINYIYTLANYNGRRYYKIPVVKSADISLAYFVSKSTKFFPEDNSLIIYIGKEYSKLIFLEGQNLKHIGTTLDIGTKNLSTYDVYFSKILLEMENGGIPRLDNIIVCGEDRSENLILSFYGTFPEANVTELSFDAVNLSGLEETAREEISAFSIPIAAAIDYLDDIDKIHSGINILPKYITENQKFLQFGWHSYAVFPFLFLAAFYFTFSILSNFKEINNLDKELIRLKELKEKNKAIVEQINPLAEKIANFDNTQAVLDAVTAGAEFWSSNLDDFSSFIERRRNFWASKIEVVEDSIQITGYSLSRSALTKFAEKNDPAVLRSMLYEPLREKNAFNYMLNIILSERLKNDNDIVKNGP